AASSAKHDATLLMSLILLNIVFILELFPPFISAVALTFFMLASIEGPFAHIDKILGSILSIRRL
ncbi:hypothetical protein ACJX0J_017531, partial [Zea mays]